MFCISCGSEINDSVKFCPACGSPQKAEEAQSSSAQAVTSSIAEYPKDSQEKGDQFESLPTDELINIATKNEPIAWVILGNRYKDGDGVEQSYDEAFKWYKKSADAGEPWGIDNLGLAYQYGWSIDEDEKKAADLYREATQLGWKAAMGHFAWMLQNSAAVEKNLEEAVKWYRLGAERGNAYCQYNLGRCFQYAEGIEQDDERAVYWYQKAANQNHGGAALALGWMYENGRGVEKDHDKAHELYLKSAELGENIAMENVALDYENGRGVEKDFAIANKWHIKAAESGNTKAMFKLGLNLEFGNGSRENWPDAKKWYQLAAENGHKEADFRSRFRKLDFTASEYKAKSGSLKFFRTSGIVLDAKRSSETHVSSSGGGGYVGPYGGNVQAAQVHSSVVTTDDIWIKTENGAEEQVSFTNKGIALRSGQRITIIHVIPYPCKKGPCLTLINHDDGNTYTIKNVREFWKSDMMKGVLTKVFMQVALIGVAVFLLSDFFSPSVAGGVTFGTIAILVLVKTVSLDIKLRRGTKLVTDHVNKIRNWAVQEG